MSLKAKNKTIFSYIHKEINQSNFMYKDFNKTSSYNSKFHKCLFTGTSLRSAAFKYCTFINCNFNYCDFVGTNFIGTKFINCTFSQCFLLGCKINKTKFKDCIFTNNVLYSCSPIIKSEYENLNIVYREFPKEDSFDTDLLNLIKKFKNNEYINRSRVIFRGSKLNTLVLNELIRQFGREKIISSVDRVNSSIKKDFYTISYLFNFFKKNMV